MEPLSKSCKSGHGSGRFQTQIPYKCRLGTVPIFPLEFVEPRKDIANARARKPRQGKTRFPRAGVRDVFPRLDELKRKNRDFSQSNTNANMQTIF